MAVLVDTPPRCWKLELWPAADCESWLLNCSPGDPFDDPRPGAALREASEEKIRKGYGRWLAFLSANTWLDPAQSPIERVTRDRLRAYLRELLRCGNAPYTVMGRFAELRMALQIIAPGADVSWVARPHGVSVRQLLPRTRRSILVPDDAVMLQWALSLMDGAAAAVTKADLEQYRDGLLLAMLASRARRLRSMTLLRVGHELVWKDGRYRIELAPDQVKTGKPDRFDLPDCLTPYVRHYLDVVRPALLGRAQHDALWINGKGGSWTAKGIQHRVVKRTRDRFGRGIGPHRFRHAVATGAALRDPGHPGVGAGVLGISKEVVLEHYNRAGQIGAAMRYDELIDGRRRTLGLAGNTDSHTKKTR